MVTVMRGGEEVKISKRAGSYLTLRDLIDEVGCDATRFFLAARKADSQLTFDIDLARSQSADNPVYYIQYAHARVCSIFRKLKSENLSWDKEQAQASLSKLELESEKEIRSEEHTSELQSRPHLVCRLLLEKKKKKKKKKKIANKE